MKKTCFLCKRMLIVGHLYLITKQSINHHLCFLQKFLKQLIVPSVIITEKKNIYMKMKLKRLFFICVSDKYHHSSRYTEQLEHDMDSANKHIRQLREELQHSQTKNFKLEADNLGLSVRLSYKHFLFCGRNDLPLNHWNLNKENVIYTYTA